MAEIASDDDLIHIKINFIVAVRHAEALAQPAETAFCDLAPGQHYGTE
jgi:hypothetical protein